MDMNQIGRALLIIGIGVTILGAVLMFISRLPFLQNLGGLPGDIKVETQGFTCFMPVASMILLSIILTIVVNIIIRLINKP